MAQVPWAGVLTDLRAALEQEVDAAMRLARRAASVEARRDAASIRLAIEVHTRPASSHLMPPPSGTPIIERLRSEREAAVLDLAHALRERSGLAERIVQAEAARKAAEGAARRIRARVRALEAGGCPSPGHQAEIGELRAALEEVRSELERERIARAAAEASLVFAERERESLREGLNDARQSRDEAQADVREARRSAAEMQSELAAVWRVLRETGAGEIMPLNVEISDDARREGVDRVQAKIIDARELFKRRSHRWPVAI